MSTEKGKLFRKGAIGALMDEYERAALELKMFIEKIPPAEFVRIIDKETSDEDCRSAQTIISHVVRAGYGYADYIRHLFSISSARPANQLLKQSESIKELESMIEYTVDTLDGKWEMPDDVIVRTTIQSLWGVTYDVEQLLEHAIVHILRHRRQIEKLMQQAQIQDETKTSDN
ncbi:MAG TPA: DinB family protein [Acidobacteriota bacterium]